MKNFKYNMSMKIIVFDFFTNTYIKYTNKKNIILNVHTLN